MDKKKSSNEESSNLVMGVAIGLCLGAGFGLVLLDNVAIGISIGLLLGLVTESLDKKGKD